MLKNSPLSLIDVGIDVLQVILAELSDREVNCLRITCSTLLQTVDAIRTPGYWRDRLITLEREMVGYDRCWFECYVEVKYGPDRFYVLGRYGSSDRIQQIIEDLVDNISPEDSPQFRELCIQLQQRLESILRGVADTNDIRHYQSFVDWAWEQIYAVERVQNIFELVFEAKSALVTAIGADTSWAILVDNLPLLKEIVNIRDGYIVTADPPIISAIPWFPKERKKYLHAYRLLVKSARSSNLAHYLLVQALMPPESLPIPPEIINQVIATTLLYNINNLGYYIQEYPAALEALLAYYIRTPTDTNPPWVYTITSRPCPALLTFLIVWWKSLNRYPYVQMILPLCARSVDKSNTRVWTQIMNSE
jgi:hypothetical protein